MIKIGFWKNDAGTKEGRKEVVAAYGPITAEECDSVIKYIISSKEGRRQRGSSDCRACGLQLGSCDMSTPDGKFTFPQKYEHYILKHYVRPPDEFIETAVEWVNGGKIPSDDQKRWLNNEELKSYQSRNLLPAPGPEVVGQWAKWLCVEREKLAEARGLLYSLKFGESLHEEEVKELDKILGYTKGK